MSRRRRGALLHAVVHVAVHMRLIYEPDAITLRPNPCIALVLTQSGPAHLQCVAHDHNFLSRSIVASAVREDQPHIMLELQRRRVQPAIEFRLNGAEVHGLGDHAAIVLELLQVHREVEGPCPLQGAD